MICWRRSYKRFLVHQGEDRASPATKQVKQEVMAQPPQPQQRPQVGADPQP